MIKIPIISETSDYIIINKPSGLLVHPPNSRYKKSTLVDFLIKKFPEMATVGDDTGLRPGIVHRLDRQVSGVMVAARTKKGFLWLKHQFKNRQVKKEYQALVYGIIQKDEGIIKFPLAKTGIKTVVRSIGQEGKEAITEFEVIKRFKQYTLVRIFLKTGRTHQIRAHFYGLNHSLVGDAKYCNSRYSNRTAFTKFIKSDKVFLHSDRLGFFDTKNQWQEFSAPIPNDLRQFLSTLGYAKK